LVLFTAILTIDGRNMAFIMTIMTTMIIKTRANMTKMSWR
jgi:hypothetical protein